MLGGRSLGPAVTALTAGAYINWLIVALRLRVYTQVQVFLESRLKDNSGLLRLVSGTIILLFFTFYPEW